MISNEDLILAPLYLIFIFALARLIKLNNINQYPEFKYFVKGLWFKIIGVSAFISIYLFYYELLYHVIHLTLKAWDVHMQKKWR